MAEKRVIDWERIALDYRAGILTLREIAAQSGVSHQAIAKKAKAEGWERDIAAKAQAKADILVAKAMVAKTVDKEKLGNENAVIEASARAIADVKLAHRTDINRYRNLLNRMMAELEHQTEHNGLYEELGDLLYKPDDKGQDRLNEIYRKVIGLPQRTKVIVDLANTLKVLIALERESYRMDEDHGNKKTDSIDDLIAAVNGCGFKPKE